MVSDTVKQVLSAESESDKLVAAAKEQCEKIIADADQCAEDLLREKTAEAEAAGAGLMAETRTRIEQYRLETAGRSADEKKRLQAIAEENMEDAVDAVIRQLFE